MAGFEVVQEPSEPVPFPKHPPKAGDNAAAMAGIAALKVGLAVLAQRTVVALSNLFCLLTVGSVFWLFMSIHEPNVFQIVYCTIYAFFVVVLNWIVRSK